MAENQQVDSPASDAGGYDAGALGLDIGTSRIVLANGPQGTQSQSQLNAFISVPYAKLTENILQQNRMVYHRNGKELCVYGNDSERFASFFNAVPRRPMQRGVLNAHEAMGQQIIQAIIEQMLPRARKNEMICFSVPGKGEGADANLVYHEAVLRNFLQGFGYQAKAINEGLAVVFAELQQENFTGIGISLGGGMCNVCVAFLSVPMLSFSIPMGGDYIDSSVSEVTAEPVTRVRLQKEESLDLARQPKDKVASALQIYYEEVMATLINKLREEFENSNSIPRLDRPLPIVLSGGTAKPRGFLQKFEGMLKASGFPAPVSEVRLASDPLTATARGCFIAALSEIK
ncbi:MAG: cell division FtsA domain-containing protein [Acidobacteria bacterium]|nr:cell division FtsA domain-containing protein [Acidobacteriota bacterium]MCW5968952.1 cell division FtsA domain-containing protein [Blastocatellales bacterium]